ncbi:SPOR domain-containing protein [Devosia rhodophyticola]|uniref:SPOR domain-containing protein n=1 Tax=Devosia rhodophyticola TaxID=3026423 RepID=A0ABY7YWK3_9HYPH|nr:SPOR domain-containing protein [Devosia rhodophyticola]WDR05753.1 SPOR domain-containing protein [Devosia rhodophyticola]
MTTAKPQQTSGNGEAADDLIAELAKLMAQDAQAERPEAKSTPEPAPTPVRIPGVTHDTNAPKDTVVPRSEQVQLEPSQGEVPPAQADGPVEKQFVPASPQTRSAPHRPAPDENVTTPEVASDDHDAIADLIAAEAESPTPAAEKAVDEQTDAPEPLALSGKGWAASEHLTQPSGPSSPIRRANVPVAPSTPDASEQSHAGGRVEPEMGTPAGSSRDDNFKVAPIFGLGGPKIDGPSEGNAPETQSNAAVQAESIVDNTPVEPSVTADKPRVAEKSEDVSAAETDPIAEIENLIGQAVRVHLDPQPKPVASNALRDLAGQESQSARVAPELASHEGGSDSDAAILAAAQSRGAEVSWADTGEIDEADELDPPPRSNRKRRTGGLTRAFAGPVVAVALLLVAGIGLYWVLGMDGPDNGPVPTLLADTTPTKGAPETPPAAETPQQSVVFNEIDGVTPTENETLVSRDQSQADEVTQLTASAVTTEEGLANRKVRTVTVRPDGTIVSSDEAVAGTAILPVDRPDVPDVPGAGTASPELLAAASGDVATAVAATEPEPVTIAPATPGSMVPAVDGNGVPIPGKTAPVAMLRPSTFTNTNVAAPPVEVAPTVPTSPINAVVSEPTQTTQTSAVSTAPAYVQLSSQRSEEDAQTTVANLQSRFGSLFGGSSLQIQRVDLGAKGIYFRVLLPSSSLQVATQTCSSVKANGGDCFAF